MAAAPSQWSRCRSYAVAIIPSAVTLLSSMKNIVITLLAFSVIAQAGTPLPPVLLQPGPEYADEARMFQGIPAIERAPNGRLWAAWYGGGVTEDKHNYVVLVTSGDDGRTWQRALIFDPDRDGPVRAFDPCLWHDPDGKLWLFWAQRPDSRPADCVAITTTESGKADAKWSAPRRVFEGIMMNKPTVAADSRWLMPAAVWGTNGSSRVVASSDSGKTFKLIGSANVPEPKDRNCDENMIVQRKNDSFWMLVRTKYGIGESISKDGGKSWSDVAPSTIPHPVTRFFIRRLASDKLLLVRHNPPEKVKARSHLTAYLSDDDGKTWKGGLLLDERKNVSYPDGVQAADGLIYVIYDWERIRDKEILMAAFTEDDVLAGKLASSKGRLRVLVNKATGVNPGPAARGKRTANADGAPLLDSPAPEIEFGDGQGDTLVPGAKLFLDRDYPAHEVPAALRGRKFVRFSIAGGKAICRRPGVVYVLTPSAGRQRDSLALWLEKHGFKKVNIPEFMIFDGEQNISSVFQKAMKQDETLVLGKWGVLVLAGKDAKLTRLSSEELAANPDTLPLWDAKVPFPPYEATRDLDVVTHVQVERAQRGGYHYLHEPALAWHNGVLHAGWANHPLFEANEKDELLRGRCSTDGGLTWGPATTWIAPPSLGGKSWNHPVIFAREGKLWGFFTRWEKELPRVEIFNLDDAKQTWQPVQAHIPGFIPFTPPRKMRDGNWIMGGELGWTEAAIAISHGDDFKRWDTVKIPRPDAMKLLFPETTLFERGDTLIAICRPRDMKTAPASISKDCGRTWTTLSPSNFPLAQSKPLCGRLSTGQQYLITCNLEQGRSLLSIAVTAPGGDAFCRIWKIRHQQTPVRRLLGSANDKKTKVGGNTEWSYPAAIEHEGKLYVIYTHGKEDCALSIIPVSALAMK
ncbi:MAG: exo-alpha-sialidase [Verrucomicrobia bacterium]|nr:exo-alpha-sialidase [Verrucomicrobiota bacterium]